MKRSELHKLLMGIETLDWCSDDHPEAYKVLSVLAPPVYAVMWSVVVAEVFKSSTMTVASLATGRVYLLSGSKAAVYFTGSAGRLVSSQIDLIISEWRSYWGSKGPTLQVCVEGHNHPLSSGAPS